MHRNHVILTGTAKASVEATTLRDGHRVMDFTLVVRDNVSRRPTFVDCVAKGAEIVDGQLEGFVNEGEEFEVEGHLTFRTFTRPDGTMRSGLVVYVESAQAV